MNRFFRELQHREVFRTVGLYVGVCWILTEAASILLPTFAAPEWVLRGIIIVAIVGLPIVTVLAWIYDISERGIARDADQAGTLVPALGGRRMDFVVIGVLAVALTLSLYLNVTSGPEIVEELEPVSVLIADFENSTGEAIFDGLLEQALNIGIESAPHIGSFDRRAATSLAEQLQPGAEGLPAAVARLIAVREGVDIVLSASIEASESGFRLNLLGLDPLSGESIFDASTQATSRDAILAAIGSLSAAVREELGDNTLKQGEDAIAETFTAASIEAADTYMDAMQLAYDGRHEEAIENFRTATVLDPNFGRAFSGWALSEIKLGRDEEASALWDKALSLMTTMTERERLRTLGLYYGSITRNYDKAVESFAELVEKYPADAAGRNNLAVTAFRALDFQRAAVEGRRILEIYPNGLLYRTNFALYAMYSGEFDAAAAEARLIIEDDPEYGTSYLPLAISLLATGDSAGAREAYQRMLTATTSQHRESMATLGLADVSIYVGELEQAHDILLEGIERDIAGDALSAAAVKHIALAEAFVVSGDYSMAIAAANDALDLSGQDSIKIASAIIFLESADLESATNIANELAGKLQTHSRAYGMMIKANILRRSGENVEAIDTLRAAADLADLWRIRFELGRAYLDAGFFAEAFDEFENCLERRGEATAMFLDDTPTVRYLAELPYWTARAQNGLGMETSSVQNYQAFLALRPQGGPLAEDARRRLQ